MFAINYKCPNKFTTGFMPLDKSVFMDEVVLNLLVIQQVIA